MTKDDLRNEHCKIEGYNYIDFETINQAEKYILFLENKIEALSKHLKTRKFV